MNLPFPRWISSEAVKKLIDLALQEDLGEKFSDITSEILFKNKDMLSQAKIISKNSTAIILCGLPLIPLIFSELNKTVKITHCFKEGDIVQPGESLVMLEASACALLMAERTILNFLQRLCAVATLTNRFVQCVKGTSLQILDTRKTTPGFRFLEKYAVFCGGGMNHRQGLYDAVLIKDNHSDLSGGIREALKCISPSLKEEMPVIVEVRTLEELEIVLNTGREKVTRVLLDNMPISLMQEAVQRCRGIFPTEASGNINLDNVREIAETGVNFASIGRLTHSAGSVDLSMVI